MHKYNFMDVFHVFGYYVSLWLKVWPLYVFTFLSELCGFFLDMAAAAALNVESAAEPRAQMQE